MEQNKKILSELESELQSVLIQIRHKLLGGKVSILEQEWLKNKLISIYDLSLLINRGEFEAYEPLKTTPEADQERILEVDKIESDVQTKAEEPKPSVEANIKEEQPITPSKFEETLVIKETVSPKDAEKAIKHAIDKVVKQKFVVKEDVHENVPLKNTLREASYEADPLKLIEKVDLKIMAEKFKTSGKSLHESVGEQTQPQKGLYDKIQATAVKSISQGIGINDKFLFVKELFNGDSNAFQHTIANLDKAESLDDVLNYLKSKFDWDTESEHVQKLLGIARRKFAQGNH